MCPNIHDLKNILEKIEIDSILETVWDKRLTSLAELPVIQLRDECDKLNLSKKGKKVLCNSHLMKFYSIMNIFIFKSITSYFSDIKILSRLN